MAPNGLKKIAMGKYDKEEDKKFNDVLKSAIKACSMPSLKKHEKFFSETFVKILNLPERRYFYDVPKNCDNCINNQSACRDECFDYGRVIYKLWEPDKPTLDHVMDQFESLESIKMFFDSLRLYEKEFVPYKDLYVDGNEGTEETETKAKETEAKETETKEKNDLKIEKTSDDQEAAKEIVEYYVVISECNVTNMKKIDVCKSEADMIAHRNYIARDKDNGGTLEVKHIEKHEVKLY